MPNISTTKELNSRKISRLQGFWSGPRYSSVSRQNWSSRGTNVVKSGSPSSDGGPKDDVILSLKKSRDSHRLLRNPMVTHLCTSGSWVVFTEPFSSSFSSLFSLLVYFTFCCCCFLLFPLLSTVLRPKLTLSHHGRTPWSPTGGDSLILVKVTPVRFRDVRINLRTNEEWQFGKFTSVDPT